MKKFYPILLTAIICFSLSGCSSGNPPTIVLDTDNIAIEVGDDFSPLQYARATDDIDGDLTSSISVKSNNVDDETPGIYTVILEVKDSDRNTTQATLLVEVLTPATDLELAIMAQLSRQKNNSILMNSI